MRGVSHIIIEKDIENFESIIVDTIKSLINKYEIDFQNEIKIHKETHEYKEYINCLIKYNAKLPYYLKGFLFFDEQ